jgi:hypothetical protein
LASLNVNRTAASDGVPFSSSTNTMTNYSPEIGSTNEAASPAPQSLGSYPLGVASDRYVLPQTTDMNLGRAHCLASLAPTLDFSQKNYKK